MTQNPNPWCLGWAANADWQNTLSPCFPSIPAMSSCSQEERHCFSYGRNRPSAKSSTTSTANSLTFTA